MDFAGIWDEYKLIVLGLLFLGAVSAFLILSHIRSSDVPITSNRYCAKDSDCVVFGEDGDCNCGCYNIRRLPTDTGGRCFTLAPDSCVCENNTCIGVYE